MNGTHPDLETLADAAEGLLDPGLATQVSAHVADCASCADQIVALEDVRTMLQSLPDVPMPPEVAQRLEAAFAVAGLEPSITTGGQSSGTVLPMDRRRRHRWSLTVAGSAAASLVVLVAVVIGLHGAGSGTKATSGAADANTPLSAAGVQELPVVTHSGRDYTQSNLATALPDLLATSTVTRLTAGLATPPGDPASAPSPEWGRMSADANDPLTTCVNSVAPGETPLAIDVASYDGKPATVIVLPSANAGRVDVWVMDSPCRGDTFLLYQQLPVS